MDILDKLAITIELQNPSGFGSLPEASTLENWCEAAIQPAAHKQAFEDSLSVLIRVVDADESANLNQTYRQKEGPTNVLSFANDVPDFMLEINELSEQNSHLGDLVICHSLVEKEAAEQEKPVIAHWAHLIVHGILHLQGFDHIDEADAVTMEALETKILVQLGFNDPYNK